VAVADIAPRAPDPGVIALAVQQSRVLLTEDKDFGQLVYASGTPTADVVLLRYGFKARVDAVRTLLELVQQKGDQLTGAFVVVQPGRARIRPGAGLDET